MKSSLVPMDHYRGKWCNSHSIPQFIRFFSRDAACSNSQEKCQKQVCQHCGALQGRCKPYDYHSVKDLQPWGRHWGRKDQQQLEMNMTKWFHFIIGSSNNFMLNSFWRQLSLPQNQSSKVNYWKMVEREIFLQIRCSF